MTAQIVEQVELFSEAELQSLEFVPEELEAIEAERVPDLDSISFEDIAEALEASFMAFEDTAEANLESFLSKLFSIFKPRGRRRRRQTQGQTPGQPQGQPRPRLQPRDERPPRQAPPRYSQLSSDPPSYSSRQSQQSRR
jgi:hypothetical protein